jgi:hypothetical protein
MNVFSQKLLSAQPGWAAVDADGNVSAFDSDLAWVKSTAEKKGEHRLVRVAPDVTSAWLVGDMSKPIEVHEAFICFAGGAIGAAVMIGRGEAIEKALGVMPGSAQKH